MYKVDVEKLFKSCVNSYCKAEDDEERDTIVCDHLELLGSQCACEGVEVAWRTPYLCRTFMSPLT